MWRMHAMPHMAALLHRCCHPASRATVKWARPASPNAATTEAATGTHITASIGQCPWAAHAATTHTPAATTTSAASEIAN